MNIILYLFFVLVIIFLFALLKTLLFQDFKICMYKKLLEIKGEDYTKQEVECILYNVIYRNVCVKVPYILKTTINFDDIEKLIEETLKDFSNYDREQNLKE